MNYQQTYYNIIIICVLAFPQELFKTNLQYCLYHRYPQRSALGVATARVRYVPSGSLTSHIINCEELWDKVSGLSSLSEKTRKSNHLQMLLQRKHFLLSYLKTLSSLIPYQLSQPALQGKLEWEKELANFQVRSVYTTNIFNK